MITDIMSSKILTAKTDTPFNEVVKVFTHSNLNHLPILNNNGALRAIITSTDVLKAIHEMDQFAINYNGYSIEKRLSVKEEMSSDVITISEETEINEVVQLMVENNIHSLPVLKENEMIGILTSNDILKAIHEGKLKLS